MSARDRIGNWLRELLAVPGLSGHEDRVRRHLAGVLGGLGIESRSDVLGNLIAGVDGGLDGPSVVLIAHMDQLGFVVRGVTPEGLMKVERLGGVPERALAAQDMLICVGEGRDIPGVVAVKSHHATEPAEKYRVAPWRELHVDAGFGSAAEAAAAGVRIGTPIVYHPRLVELAGGRIAAPAVDDRAGCAVILEVLRAIAGGASAPRVHAVFSVQEEFNLRGALPAVRALAPEVAIQLDLMLASDTPEMAGFGEIRLGGGPTMSLYSFHGRGTLNGLLPHPALVGLFEQAAEAAGLDLQRSAHVGALTETSYVQLEGAGVACIDLGFPVRQSHAPREICDPGDLEGLAALVLAGLGRMGPDFTLDRDAWT